MVEEKRSRKSEKSNRNYSEEFQLLVDLLNAYRKARKGKRKTEDENRIEINFWDNIVGLRDSIIAREYKPGRSLCFVSHRPVDREIFAAPFRDRIIHHYIFDMVAEWWEKKFIRDSYSCRKGKGTLDAIKRLESHIKSASKNYTVVVYIIKLDVKGFFTSMSRKLLYKLAIDGLDEQFPEKGWKYETIKYLWRQVIFDDPTEGARVRGSIEEWKYLVNGKSMFYQEEGRGIVIGNLTSQLLSNIMMNQLDQYVKNNLGYKHYGRYVDDFFIVVEEKDLERAKKDIKKIRRFLWSELGLRLHPNKIYIQEAHKGVEFVGAVIYPGFRLPSKRLKRNFLAALSEYARTGVSEEGIISYLGLLQHLNAAKLTEKAFLRVGFNYGNIMAAKKKGGKALVKVLREEKERARASRMADVRKARTGELGSTEGRNGKPEEGPTPGSGQKATAGETTEGTSYR